jgi:hypothetical protein
LKEAAEETRRQQRAVAARREAIAFQVDFEGGGGAGGGGGGGGGVNDGMSVERIERRKKESVSAPVSRERDRPSKNRQSSGDGVHQSTDDDGVDSNHSLSKGGRPKRESIYREKLLSDQRKANDGLPLGLLAQEGKGRQRKGWGRPIDPFNPSPLSVESASPSPSAAAQGHGEEEEATGGDESGMNSGILGDVFGGE